MGSRVGLSSSESHAKWTRRSAPPLLASPSLAWSSADLPLLYLAESHDAEVRFRSRCTTHRGCYARDGIMPSRELRSPASAPRQQHRSLMCVGLLQFDELNRRFTALEDAAERLAKDSTTFRDSVLSACLTHLLSLLAFAEASNILAHRAHHVAGWLWRRLCCAAVACRERDVACAVAPRGGRDDQQHCVVPVAHARHPRSRPA